MVETSGTFAFTLTAEEMVAEAYERCGFDPNLLTQYDAQTARRSLNLLFSEWSVRGINFWNLVEDGISTVTGQSTYILPQGTIDIFAASLRRTNVDTTMQRISITDYHAYPNKDSSGRPSVYVVDRQVRLKVTLWQVPNNTTDIFQYWRWDQIEDIDRAFQSIDAPYRWTEAICAGLAAKLSLKKSPDRFALLKVEADTSFDYANDDEREKASLVIVPG
jgi:hypothetical protein